MRRFKPALSPLRAVVVRVSIAVRPDRAWDRDVVLLIRACVARIVPNTYTRILPVKIRQGFLRMYIVALVVWEALMIGIAATNPGPGNTTAIFVMMAVVLPVLVYVMIFLVIPWIVRGFK